MTEGSEEHEQQDITTAAASSPAAAAAVAAERPGDLVFAPPLVDDSPTSAVCTPSAPQRTSEEAGPSGRGDPDDDEEENDEVIEQAPGGRYSRYSHQVGKGRFKSVYKGFDEQQGIDVAWSKIPADANSLTQQQVNSIIEELSKGLSVDHQHIIKCYKCWEDPSTHCINLITEYFTSGNLRDYRQRHKHLGMKAVKKWARQILLGLKHLHARDPPIVHGDLRCDKIYINGHTGEIKIGDLGLATLLSRRYAHGCNGSTNGVAGGGSGSDDDDSTAPVPTSPPSMVPDDVFAFGLCLLELVSLKKLDYEHCVHYPDILRSVADDEASAFISQCLAPEECRPTTGQLMEDPFLSNRKLPAPPPTATTDSTSAFATASSGGGGEPGSATASGAAGGGIGGGSSRRSTDLGNDQDALMVTPSYCCEVGVVRGEDYTFHFGGTITDGTLSFRLHMQYEGDDGGAALPPDEAVGGNRTIDFVYDPDVDTPEKIADEISGEFSLSSTDRDICAAALKEWLARNAPS